MDYVEAFKSLKTNNKYSRKTPHKAILLLTVIKMIEANILSENTIYYNEELKETYLKTWDKILGQDPKYNPDIHFPFWYLQNDGFWHITPKRGHEDTVKYLKENDIKPSEERIVNNISYVELDENLYFLMTLASGRSQLKRTLLETYTNLSEEQIESLSESVKDSIDYSITALADYKKIVAGNKEKENTIINDEEPLEGQFSLLNEDLQILLNYEYFSFLKKNRNERGLFKKIFPTVFDLYDKIVYHPLRKNELNPSFSFTYENFLIDLKFSLMDEEDSIEIIDRINEAIEILHKDYKGKDDLIIGDNNNLTQDNEPEVYAGSIRDENKNPIKDILITPKSSINDIAEETSKESIDKVKEGQESTLFSSQIDDFFEREGYKIENTKLRCSILNKYDEIVYQSTGILKFIRGKLYRLNLKEECFTIKDVYYNGSIWVKGKKKIVAYPYSDLYKKLVISPDYSKDIEEIVDSSIFDLCKLRIYGCWYNNKGDCISGTQIGNSIKKNTDIEDNSHLGFSDESLIDKRKKAIIRAMTLFRTSTTITEITRTISRTAWGEAPVEEDVMDLIDTMSEIEMIRGRYYLRNNKR